MDRYTVKLLPKAYKDIDSIYEYVLETSSFSQTADNLVGQFENTILSLEHLPYRGALRKVGVFAESGYRQLFIKNFTIIYRVNEKLKEVVIVTVRYSGSDF